MRLPFDFRSTPSTQPVRYRTAAPRPRIWPVALGVAVALSVLALSACSTKPPPGIQPVTGFDVDRYTGHWYEVARIDQRFEAGLVRTHAEYRRNADGSLTVINRGYDPKRDAWKESRGRAVFVDEPTRAALKVSFFGPFYSAYNVVALDENYQWAMVMGASTDSLWILSRTPDLPNHVLQHLVERAQAMGVDTAQILWVPQDRTGAAGPSAG